MSDLVKGLREAATGERGVDFGDLLAYCDEAADEIERLEAELVEARRELEIARKASAALYGGPPIEDVIRDAERYRWLREAQNDDIGVAQGFGTVDVGGTGVADTYERVLYRANLDAAIDAARHGDSDG